MTAATFPKIFARALALADYDGFAQRRIEAEPPAGGCAASASPATSNRRASRRRASPARTGARVGFYEAASIRVEPDGAVRAMLGTHNHGQGHATTFAQILASKLGVAVENVEVERGRHRRRPARHRHLRLALDRGRRLRARSRRRQDRRQGQADRRVICWRRRRPTSISPTARSWSPAPTAASSFAEVARAAYVPHNFPLETLEPGLQETAVYDPPSFAFSNGAHVCELEIDPQTGRTEIVGFWGVDDIGTVINPMIVEGQIHGGLALGLGQALFERCAYDGGGQLLSGSFMDYAVARADDLPLFVTECDESQPCTHNPLGAKGCGEAGSIGAPAAVVSAALDALAGLGVTDLEMPLTPEQIWRRIGEYETVRHDLETRQPKPKKKPRRRRTNDGGGEKAT